MANVLCPAVISKPFDLKENAQEAQINNTELQKFNTKKLVLVRVQKLDPCNK